jgi:hypothetical protein
MAKFWSMLKEGFGSFIDDEPRRVAPWLTSFVG